MKNTVLIYLFAVLFMGMASPANAGSKHHAAPRAVTLWWVIFKNPNACTANPGGVEQCGSADVFGQSFLDSVANGSPDPSLISPNTDAGLAVLYATGGVTDRFGRVDLIASIYRTPDSGLNLTGPSVSDPMGLGVGFENPEAEVHLVVRDHGRRSRSRSREGQLLQVTNFLEPYCSDPNLLFFSGPNTCADVQFAIFGPNEAGEDDVFAFGTTPTRVRKASATLIRNGDLIQAVVRTRIPKQ